MNDLFLKIINMSISASWLVLAVLLLRFVLKKAPKWVNVLLWGIVAVRLAFPFSIESALSLIPSAETVPMDIEMAVQPTINSGVPVINSMVNPMLSSFAPPQDVLTSANPLQIWIPIFSILWIAGIAALLLYTVVSYWRLRRKVSEAVILRDNIFQSENVASPFVLGVFRPKIYLPYNMGGQDLNHVVAHEQAHIRRRDHWWKPLGFLLLTIHWFNPLMWLAYVLLCRDIELACDEKVIKVLGNEQRADYTQALVACSVNRRVIAACPLAFGEVGVKERVKSVMNYKKPAFWVVVLAVIACVVVAVCFLTDPEQDSYTLRIVVPAGSQDDFVYSDEEVSTTGNSIVIWSGEGLDDTEVLLFPVDETTETGYTAMYIYLALADDLDTRIDIRDGGVTEFIGADHSEVLLAKAINEAILAENKPSKPDGLYHCASFVLLDQQELSGTPAVGSSDHIKLVTVYGLALHQGFGYSGGTFHDAAGSHIAVAITFEVVDGKYVLKEYWTPRDGSYYVQDIRDKFPDEIEDEALDTQKYILAQKQECYDQAVRYGGVDTYSAVEHLFEVIESSPATSSRPADYIDAHPIEYRELTYYGSYTLQYVFSQFLEGGQTGLRGHLMRSVLDDLAPEAQLRLYAETGQEYFDEWKAGAIRISEQHDME